MLENSKLNAISKYYMYQDGEYSLLFFLLIFWLYSPAFKTVRLLIVSIVFQFSK